MRLGGCYGCCIRTGLLCRPNLTIFAIRGTLVPVFSQHVAPTIPRLGSPDSELNVELICILDFHLSS